MKDKFFYYLYNFQYIYIEMICFSYTIQVGDFQSCRKWRNTVILWEVSGDARSPPIISHTICASLQVLVSVTRINVALAGCSTHTPGQQRQTAE